MRRNGEKAALSEMIHTHSHTCARTHRGHCLVVLPRGPVITEAETDERVAPLFLPHSSFHLLPVVSCPLPPCIPELLQSLINRRKIHMALVDADPDCSRVSANIYSTDGSRRNQRDLP